MASGGYGRSRAAGHKNVQSIDSYLGGIAAVLGLLEHGTGGFSAPDSDDIDKAVRLLLANGEAGDAGTFHAGGGFAVKSWIDENLGS